MTIIPVIFAVRIARGVSVPFIPVKTNKQEVNGCSRRTEGVFGVAHIVSGYTNRKLQRNCGGRSGDLE